jgi:uncharacterized protein YgiM (DUF1202 family)
LTQDNDKGEFIMKYSIRRTVFAVLGAALWLVLSTTSTLAQGSGMIRFVHAIPGATGVDVYTDSQLATSNLGFGASTSYFSVAAGSHDVKVTPTGATNALWQQTIAVDDGSAETLIAASASTPSFLVYPDDITPLAEGKARFTAIHAISGGPTVDLVLSDGRPVIPGMEFGKPAGTLDIPEFDYDFVVVPTGEAVSKAIVTPDTIQVKAGNSYVLVVYGTVDAPASLVLSSPIPPEATETVVAQVQATAAPTVAAPPPTLAPTLPPAPTAAPVVAGPTGRVFNMDADANLQLRQYPNSNALSLGTVPPGTILNVNGREGAIADIPFSATPSAPADYTFTDPATLLKDEKEDLDPVATWLNITYNTPDGGSITAWVDALYVQVSDEKGKKMRLADLPLVSSNLPGSVNNTAITPPPVPQDRVAATAFNLDAGVNLNIRRTPEANGEVLARVPNGTVMEFLGINKEQSWVFVKYSAPEGGTVTGWVSAEYVEYSYNGRPIKLDEIDQRGLLVTTPDDTRGEVTAGTSPVAQPTVNPAKDAYIATVVLDPGSNLNLRRDPTSESEVVGQIPSGTQLIVIARSEDGNWLNVTFEDTKGWVAAKTDTAVFVRITFNGKEAQIDDIPVSGQVATAVAPTATEDNLTSLPVVVNDAVVAMTGSPGGNSDGLPVLTKGQQATLLFTDGTFSYIELPDGTRGWVPAGSVLPR